MAGVVNFGGLASGIDSSSIIAALLGQQRSTRIAPLETRIEQYSDTNQSLQKLSELLSAVGSAADRFRTVNGGGIAKSATSSDETVLTAAASPAAEAGTYSVTATQIARNATTSLRSALGTYSSADAIINPNIVNGAPSGDRTVTIDIGSGGSSESVAIELTNSTTLTEFVANFNSQTSSANAAVVNVGTTASPDYRVVISSNSTGIERGQLTVTAGTGVTNPDGNAGTADGAFNNNALSQALDAQFTISGLSGTITRSSNSINDLFSGVTFQLEAIGSATVTVNPDTSTSTNNLKEFVTAYNELVTYVEENDLVSRESDSGSATDIVFNPLASTSLDESVLSALREGFRGLGVSGSLGSLADLGLSTRRDGTLAFDETAFATAVNSDPAGAAAVLENLGNSLSGVDGTIAQFTRFGGLIDTAINANTSAVTSLNDRIAEIEKNLLSYENSLTQQYSRFEALIGKLNAQQTSLTSALGG